MSNRAGVWVALLCCGCASRAGGDLPGAGPGGTGAGGDLAGSGEGVSGSGGSLAEPGAGASGASEPSSSGPAESTFGPPGPPPELAQVDPGYPLVVPAGGMCPAGTAPSERFWCTDVPYCYCEYVCAPACGAGEVCMPAGAAGGAASCQCHGALEASDGGCVWRGLGPDPSFDDASSWRLYARSVSGDGAAAEVSEGRLQLSVAQRCGYAWAGTAARLPAASQLPAGAALVFDYRAASDAPDASSAIGLRLQGLQAGAPLDLSGSPAQTRRCISLPEEPRLALLELSIESNGTCAEAVSYELEVDNLRLEADPSCG